jgi:hypothetical protein
MPSYLEYLFENTNWLNPDYKGLEEMMNESTNSLVDIIFNEFRSNDEINYNNKSFNYNSNENLKIEYIPSINLLEDLEIPTKELLENPEPKPELDSDKKNNKSNKRSPYILILNIELNKFKIYMGQKKHINTIITERRNKKLITNKFIECELNRFIKFSEFKYELLRYLNLYQDILKNNNKYYYKKKETIKFKQHEFELNTNALSKIQLYEIIMNVLSTIIK